MHHAFKKPPSFENHGTTGVCLGRDSRIAGGVLVVSVVNGELKEACSAKAVGQACAFMFILRTHQRLRMLSVRAKSNGASMR